MMGACRQPVERAQAAIYCTPCAHVAGECVSIWASQVFQSTYCTPIFDAVIPFRSHPPAPPEAAGLTHSDAAGGAREDAADFPFARERSSLLSPRLAALQLHAVHVACASVGVAFRVISALLHQLTALLPASPPFSYAAPSDPPHRH